MPLSGLDIYKLLPKTNCKECGFATCLAFAMALAQKKIPLEKCPHVSAQAREALESASQPPIRLVAIGTGQKRIEIGNETVMYRHEQKFFHHPAVGFVIDDSLDDEDLARSLRELAALSFERAGQTLRIDLVCIRNVSGYRNKFINAIKKAVAVTDLRIALLGADPELMGEALSMSKAERPLLVCNDAAQLDAFIALAREHAVPLAVPASGIDGAAEAAERAKKGGVEDIVIHLTGMSLARQLQAATYIRRTALKKNLRSLGYPVMVFTQAAEPDEEACEAATAICKYAGIVILRNASRSAVFPLLVLRQDIYTDPQKPVQVEPKIYEIGRVTQESPVLITTNFSITYFTVAGEVEASKVPAYIICTDAEGMSVLTAWAAEKFTAEKIDQALKKCGIAERVTHRTVIIPGYVAVLSGKLQEVSGWKVIVGPREASGITAFLRGL